MQDVNSKCKTKLQSIAYVLATTKVIKFRVFCMRMLQAIAQCPWKYNIPSRDEFYMKHVRSQSKAVEPKSTTLTSVKDMSCPSASIQTQKQSNPAKHFALVVSASGPLEKKKNQNGCDKYIFARKFILCDLPHKLRAFTRSLRSDEESDCSINTYLPQQDVRWNCNSNQSCWK